jgi:ribosomal protein L7/L12
MSNPLPEGDLEKIRSVIAEGNKIDAIKLFRELTGAGLAEAKEAVEALQAGRPIRGIGIQSLSDEDVNEIQAAIFAGNKIEAIKVVRAATGMGLKGAKDFVESLQVELRRTDPGKFTSPPAKGCGMTIFAIVVVFALLIGMALA